MSDAYPDEDLRHDPGCSGDAYCLNEHECPEVPLDAELAEAYWRDRAAWLHETFDLPPTPNLGGLTCP